MIRPNAEQLQLPLEDTWDSWDIFNAYAENREDLTSPLSSHWSTAHRGFPESAVEDPYYLQSAAAFPTQQSRFSLDEDELSSLRLKLKRWRMSADAGGNNLEDDGLRALLSAQASKSKRAFGKFMHNLAHGNDETDERKLDVKSAAPRLRRPEPETPLQISSPVIVDAAPVGRATTYVRRVKALPPRPSPIPAI